MVPTTANSMPILIPAVPSTAATAATTVTFLIQFLHLGATPDQ